MSGISSLFERSWHSAESGILVLYKKEVTAWYIILLRDNNLYRSIGEVDVTYIRQKCMWHRPHCGPIIYILGQVILQGRDV